MKQSNREKWTKQRERGFTRYMLVNGLLYIGLPVAIFFGLLANTRRAFDLSGEGSYFSVACGIFTGIVFGLFFGFARWRGQEDLFNWRERRTAGLLRYVLVDGILLKGLPLAAVFAVIAFNYFVFSNRKSITYDVTFSAVAKLISVGILLGTMYGFSTWYSIESKTFWSDTRSGGKALFVVKHGLLLYGWPYAISMTAFNYLLKYRTEFTDLEHYLVSVEAIGSFVFYALFFGLIMGFISWSANEKEHAKPDDGSVLHIS